MNIREENEALKEACKQALDAAKRTRLNMKEVMRENEELKHTIDLLNQELQMRRNAMQNRSANKQREIEALESIARDADWIGYQVTKR